MRTEMDQQASGSLCVHRTSLPPHQQALPKCITQALPGRETAPPLHTMAPAFMAELPSMPSWFPMVVVVDGGSKEAVHHVVWGGTANECLRSVSKRTKKLEQNLLQLYPENLTFRTLDHRMVAARVPTSVPKGKTIEGREEEAGRAR